ncbi:NB-ARC domain-containing protein [Streptomyces asoensis]|uniref:NB-ARC domain-containing protein n=1 Tax=Streptomyces asoensis TaxID=249586 RepID=UPI00332234B5
MAVLLDQDTFTQPEKGAVARDDALVLHRHPEADRVRTLTLLVHGWGGRRYSTWKGLPQLLFADFPDMDIALYDYVSGLRRMRRTRSESLRSTIDHLADTLRDIDHYDRGYEEVFLLAHSMGGLFTQAAVLRLLDGEPAGERNSVLRRLSGLFLLAVPRAGSFLLPPFTPGFRDARLLRIHNPQATAIQKGFTNRVNMDPRPGEAEQRDRLVLPTYGMRASRDRCVDDLSATMGLPDYRFKTVRGTHTSIIKPRDRDHEGYRWLWLRMNECLRERRKQEPESVAATDVEARTVPHFPPLLSPRSADWRDSADVPRDTRFGIDRDTADLVHELGAADGYRMVSLRGRGGAGKTTLAYDVTDRLARTGAFRRVAWVSAKFQRLDAVGQIKRQENSVEWVLLLVEIARQLGLSVDRNTVEEQLPALLRGLSEQERCLIVLDNLETVDDNARAVKYLEQIGAPHKVLITTRHSAREIAPDAIREQSWNGISEDAARQLVRHLARDEPALAQTLSTEEVDAIVRRSECVPLIIRLILSLVIQDSRTVDDVVNDLHCRSDVQQVPVAAYLFQESLSALAERVGEQNAVRLLNVFCGFAPGGSVTVTEFHERSRIADRTEFEVARSVACRLSLVQSLDANRRFTVHSLLREFICQG